MGQKKQEEPTEFTLAVHAEIRGWQGKRNLSQRRLAELAGMSNSTLSRIIGTNAQPMDLNELEALCAALGVSPEYVVAAAERSLLEARVIYPSSTPGGWYNSAGEWVPETRAGYSLAAYESDEEKGVDYDD